VLVVPGDVHLEKLGDGGQFEKTKNGVTVFGDDVPINRIVDAHIDFIKNQKANNQDNPDGKAYIGLKDPDDKADDIAGSKLECLVERGQEKKKKKCSVKGAH